MMKERNKCPQGRHDALPSGPARIRSTRQPEAGMIPGVHW